MNAYNYNENDPHHRQPQLFDDTSGYQNQGYGQQDYSSGVGNAYSYQTTQMPPYNSQQQYGEHPQQNIYAPKPMDGGYSAPPPFINAGGFPGADLIKNPLIANTALHYGQTIMGQGQEFIDKNLEKYMSVSKLKYYFAVDTKYVMKKIQLIFFPFTHSNWSVQFEQSEGVQVQPRHDVNAPDLYIPTMAFVTYILMAGLSLGLMDRFTPEVLGMQASSAVLWLALEILVVLAALHFNSGAVVKRPLHALTVLALAGYKYPGMIMMLVAAMVLPGSGFYVAQCYFTVALSLFMFRTLRSQIQNQGVSEDSKYAPGSSYNEGSKRRFYLLIGLTVLQPFFMWWLTKDVAYYRITI